MVSLELDLLVNLLSSDSLVSDETLNLGGLVESLISLFDLTADDVLAYIIALSEAEDLPDGGSSLWSESSWLLSIGNSGNVSVTFLGDGEGDDR